MRRLIRPARLPEQMRHDEQHQRECDAALPAPRLSRGVHRGAHLPLEFVDLLRRGLQRIGSLEPICPTRVRDLGTSRTDDVLSDLLEARGDLLGGDVSLLAFPGGSAVLLARCIASRRSCGSLPPASGRSTRRLPARRPPSSSGGGDPQRTRPAPSGRRAPTRPRAGTGWRGGPGPRRDSGARCCSCAPSSTRARGASRTRRPCDWPRRPRRARARRGGDRSGVPGPAACRQRRTSHLNHRRADLTVRKVRAQDALVRALDVVGVFAHWAARVSSTSFLPISAIRRVSDSGPLLR